MGWWRLWLELLYPRPTGKCRNLCCVVRAPSYENLDVLASSKCLQTPRFLSEACVRLEWQLLWHSSQKVLIGLSSVIGLFIGCLVGCFVGWLVGWAACSPRPFQGTRAMPLPRVSLWPVSNARPGEGVALWPRESHLDKITWKNHRQRKEVWLFCVSFFVWLFCLGAPFAEEVGLYR